VATHGERPTPFAGLEVDTTPVGSEAKAAAVALPEP